jgi:hypothetical protein
MSSTLAHVIALAKALPQEEQQMLCAELTNPAKVKGERIVFQRTPDGKPYDPEGIPNDHPVFKILEEIEEERHNDPGPPAPDFD